MQTIGGNRNSISNTGKRGALEGSQARMLLLIASLVTLALYFIPYPYSNIMWPVRLFVTMIHESGHAIATVVSGGQVQSLQIFPNGEGVTYSATPIWAEWLVISGGYIGTTLFGAVLLQLARYSGHKTTLMVIGGYIAAVTILWAHNPFVSAFTLAVGIVLAALFFLAARMLKPNAAAFLVTFLAVQCCLNAIGDLRILLYLTTSMPGKDNDAVFMSQHYPLPPTFWAALWAICAVAILSVSLWSYMRATSGQGSARRSKNRVALPSAGN